MLVLKSTKMWEMSIYDREGTKIKWCGYNDPEIALANVENWLREDPTYRAVVTEAMHYGLVKDSVAVSA